MLRKANGVEVLVYADYFRDEEFESSLIPGLIVGGAGPGILTCPGCSLQRDGILHGDEATCEGCGLKMRRYGNILELHPETYLIQCSENF